MAATPSSDTSHESADEANNGRQSTSKTPSVKDKECQYCHQHFTSSSLGRHLDQFIFKKKPDGIHDVEEIRKVRGGITRRTARSSRRDREKDRELDDTQSSHTTPGPGLQSGALVPSATELNRVPPGGFHYRLNRLNWQATGVITDPTTLDSPVGAAPPTPAVIPSPSGTKRSFSTFAQDATATNPTDTARALELALREVLDSLRAASKHAAPKPSPFKFDLPSQTFPSLCLKLLPAPATLFQTSPFSTPQSIPISPPGPDQLQPLRVKITATIDFWKWQSLRLAQPTTSNIAEEADFLTRSATQWAETSLSHLDASYQNWMGHPLEIRSLLWQVELLRAYNMEQQRVAELEEKLESMQQEANQLQQQVEYLSRCQWPREMALWPPERRTFGHAMREELRLINLNKAPWAEGADVDVMSPAENVNSRGDKWDFEKLVNKWKARIRDDKNRRMPQPQSTTDNGAKTAELKKSQSESAVNGVPNGASPNLNDERQRATRNPKGNISIISDL